MALIDDLQAAVDFTDPAAVTAVNAAIAKINVTRAAVATASAAGTLGAATAALAGETTTALAPFSVPSTPKPIGFITGPAAVGRL